MSRVSELLDEREEQAVALHEMTEVALCRAHGITGEDVNEFDTVYAADSPEPGDERGPYHWEHDTANVVERRPELERMQRGY